MVNIRQTAIDAVALALCTQDFGKWECHEDKELFSDYQLIAQRSLKSANCDIDTKKCVAQYALSHTFKRELTKVDIAQGILALFGIGLTSCLPEGHPPEEMTDVTFDMSFPPNANMAEGATTEDAPYNARLEDGQKIPVEDANAVVADTLAIVVDTLAQDSKAEISKGANDTGKTEDYTEDAVTNDVAMEDAVSDDPVSVDDDLEVLQKGIDSPNDEFITESSEEIKATGMCDADGDGIITGDIKDPALLDAIRTALGKGADDDITLEEAQKITKLVANGKGISDLSGIECFTNLVELQLSNNQISDVTPIAGLKPLKHLWLDGNLISDGDPLANLINIEWFFISNNPLSDISFAASLDKLFWFVAMDCNITDINPLSNSKKLDTLILDGNFITDIMPLAGVISLSTFTFHNNFVSDISVASGWIFLTVFGAGNNNISDISALSSPLFLKTASLYTNQIEDITALIENTGFGVGDTANLAGNSKIPSEQIDALKAKGVAVSW